MNEGVVVCAAFMEIMVGKILGARIRDASHVSVAPRDGYSATNLSICYLRGRCVNFWIALYYLLATCRKMRSFHWDRHLQI